MIYEFPVNHPALPALFDPAYPDHPALWAVFKGRNTGKAWVDDVHRPAQCVVRTDAVLTYFSRRVSQAFLDEAFHALEQYSPIWLIWSPEIHTLLQPPEAGHVSQRLEFYDYDPGSRILSGWRQRLPDGFAMRPIDRVLLERCEWRDEMEFFCGSLDNFLANGLGLCLMRGDEIITETYVSSFGETHAEIGAITREAHRGQGYAPLACAHLIEACERRGFHGYWSCDADNVASANTARKLGFRQPKGYQVYVYGEEA